MATWIELNAYFHEVPTDTDDEKLIELQSKNMRVEAFQINMDNVIYYYQIEKNTVRVIDVSGNEIDVISTVEEIKTKMSESYLFHNRN